MLKENKILALSYFPKGLPLKYHRRYNVSPLSSRWISVVPLCKKHQDLKFLKFWFIQVFGLLVHISWIYCYTYTLWLLTAGLAVTLFAYAMRILILRLASHLDAFSGYPCRT